MFQRASSRMCYVAASAVMAATLLFDLATAEAQTAVSAGSETVGRIDFASANLPPATVEVDLSQEIFGDLFGLGDAAIAGIVESLSQSSDEPGAETLQVAAEKLGAARQVVQLAKEVVREVRVRVYDNFSEEQGSATELAHRFDEQLSNGQWDKVVRVNDGDESVNVSFLRSQGAILGVFVVVADGNDVVLANVVCDVSPENVKKLTAAATKIGLENGLREEIERKLMRHAH
ncbi:MAG: DUF4252 domain-containing protein [Planctomycetales bacterium]|nr:DUF4252 domain-containing protein [Planctomycetales bacterium]